MVKHIETTWRFDLLELLETGKNFTSGYRYILVVIGSFNEKSWEMPLKILKI